MRPQTNVYYPGPDWDWISKPPLPRKPRALRRLVIPGRSIIRQLLLGGLLLLPGCGADTPPSVTEKPGPRSAGPRSISTMRSDPLVASSTPP